MNEKITSSLDSISFVNHLAIAKRAEIGNIVIEVKGNLSVQDALIIKNILLLLNQAKKLDYVDRPLNIAGWVTIYNKDNAPEPEPIPEDNNRKYLKKLSKRNEADDVLDALRYSLCDMPESDKKKITTIKDIQGKTISLEDVNIALNADMGNKVDQFVEANFIKEAEAVRKNKLPGGIPMSFVEDSKHMNNEVLATKYKRGVPTIRRWKRLLKGGNDNESSE